MRGQSRKWQEYEGENRDRDDPRRQQMRGGDGRSQEWSGDRGQAGYGQHGGFDQSIGNDRSGRASSPGRSGGYEVSHRQDPPGGYAGEGDWGYSGRGGNHMRGGEQGYGGYGSRAGGDYGGEGGYAADFGGQMGGGQRGTSYRYGGSAMPYDRGTRPNHRGRGPKDYKRSDSRIEEDVNDRMMEDGALDASDISVEVREGEVTINGTVRSRQEKRRAEDCAESVSGVGHVQNNLRVKPSSGETTASQAAPSDSGS